MHLCLNTWSGVGSLGSYGPLRKWRFRGEGKVGGVAPRGVGLVHSLAPFAVLSFCVSCVQREM